VFVLENAEMLVRGEFLFRQKCELWCTYVSLQRQKFYEENGRKSFFDVSRYIPQKFDSIFRTTTTTKTTTKTKTPRVEDEERVKVERCSINERCTRVFI
jgi:hypothetical protein